MIVRFEKCELKIDQIQKEEISQENFEDHEKAVISLVKHWLDEEPYFEFKTSGSTGAPKIIHISRRKIEYSASATLKKLDPEKKFKSSLLCLDPTMIGGAMVVFRALIGNMDLTVKKPSSTPLRNLNHPYDLVSIVPLQFESSTTSELEQFKTILVGGGAVTTKANNTQVNIYSTFGMTETVSHFALRKFGNSEFECIGDCEIGISDDKTMKVYGTLTDHKWLITNDLIELISTTKFKWLGRKDFIINTGGIKINPEQVERILDDQINSTFIVTSLEDEKLGNRVVLLIEGSKSDIELDFDNFEKYAKPKEIHFLKEFAYTNSQKVNRHETRKRLIDQLNGGDRN